MNICFSFPTLQYLSNSVLGPEHSDIFISLLVLLLSLLHWIKIYKYTALHETFIRQYCAIPLSVKNPSLSSVIPIVFSQFFNNSEIKFLLLLVQNKMQVITHFLIGIIFDFLNLMVPRKRIYLMPEFWFPSILICGNLALEMTGSDIWIPWLQID